MVWCTVVLDGVVSYGVVWSGVEWSRVTGMVGASE